MAPVLLLVAAMSAQNAPSTNKGRHLDIPAISREANGTVVSIIMADNKGQPIAQGSGFVVTRNGLVVTNYHVIKNGTSAVIKLPDGSFFTVDGVLAFDKDRDIAAIKAHGINFKTVALGDSDRLQIGDEVVAIGSPLSLESTVSNGIVSGIRTEEQPSNGSLLDQVTAPAARKLLQITAPISHGSSGGPLFNLAGQVIGITSAALIGGENLNFAVPINDAKKLLGTSTSKALLAFPNEPEATVDGPEKPAQTDKPDPSLADTEQWMNKFTVAYARQKGSRTVLQFNQCEVTDHPFLGINVDLGEPFEQSKELPSISYTLADIDPTQISVQLNGMNFANTNAKRSINHSSYFYSASWFVLFDSEEHANQFAKAFKHAVDLCGGKASTF
jgi:hypothetical protein